MNGASLHVKLIFPIVISFCRDRRQRQRVLERLGIPHPKPSFWLGSFDVVAKKVSHLACGVASKVFSCWPCNQHLLCWLCLWDAVITLVQDAPTKRHTPLSCTPTFQVIFSAKKVCLLCKLLQQLKRDLSHFFAYVFYATSIAASVCLCLRSTQLQCFLQLQVFCVNPQRSSCLLMLYPWIQYLRSRLRVTPAKAPQCR